MARTYRVKTAGSGGILRLRGALQRDLITLVAAKIALLTVLYMLFFSPAHRPAINVVAHIAGALSQR